MQNKLIDLAQAKQLKENKVEFRVGDNVKVHVRIKEGAKERVQIFEGLVMAKKGKGTGEAFTVRKISYGIGVERNFMLNSPLISEIEVIRTNKVRRAKLYYMRDRKGKSARLKEVKRTK